MSEETEEGVTRTKLACNHEYVQYHKELQNRQALEKKIADIWFFFKKVAESESDEE